MAQDRALRAVKKREKGTLVTPGLWRAEGMFRGSRLYVSVLVETCREGILKK